MSELPPLASGPVSSEGATTPVRISEPKIDSGDKKILCSAMCACDKEPQVGKDGQELKQVCVSAKFKGLDKALYHRSPYKQEVNYDMTKNPPAPIMDSGVATKAHGFLPAWIGKYWEAEHAAPYTRGAGLIRRPDVVIVKDPSKPPTQDNIKQIIEMKFPPDELSKDQREAYIKIAGGKGRLVKLATSDCDCDADQPKDPRMPIEELGFAAAVAAWLAYILSKGKTPRPPMEPIPPLVPAF